MKNWISSLTFLLALTMTLSLQAQDFEGIVIAKNTAKDGLDMTITKKGNLSLFEYQTEEGDVKILYDEHTGDMTTVTIREGEKMAVKMNVNDNPYLKPNARMDNYQKEEIDEKAEVKILKDEKRIIRDYPCYKVIGRDDDSEGVAWVTEAINLHMTDLVPQANKHFGDRKSKYEITGVEAFVMELHSKDLKTGEEWTMENEVIEKEISDKVFTKVTEGAQIFDMTDMRQLMMDAQNNPEKMKKMREMMMKIQKGN